MDRDAQRSDGATIRKSIEAMLFASGEPLSVERMSKVLKCGIKAVKAELLKLREEYTSRDTALEILSIGEDAFVMQIRGAYSGIARKVSSNLPISLGCMRTLALIASEQPIPQSRVIRIRGGHAYKYVKELIRIGYVKAEKLGRTSVLTTTDRFNKLLGYDDIKTIKRALQQKLAKGSNDRDKCQKGQDIASDRADIQNRHRDPINRKS